MLFKPNRRIIVDEPHAYHNRDRSQPFDLFLGSYSAPPHPATPAWIEHLAAGLMASVSVPCRQQCDGGEKFTHRRKPDQALWVDNIHPGPKGWKLEFDPE